MIIDAFAMILVFSHESCGQQRSKNYIPNIPLAQDQYSGVTRPFLARVKGLVPRLRRSNCPVPSVLELSDLLTLGLATRNVK